LTTEARADDEAEEVKTTDGFVDPAAVTGKARSPGPVSPAEPPGPPALLAVKEAPSPYK
jgi:hypothetical protein